MASGGKAGAVIKGRGRASAAAKENHGKNCAYKGELEEALSNHADLDTTNPPDNSHQAGCRLILQSRQPQVVLLIPKIL